MNRLNRAGAIVLASRPRGESAVAASLLTEHEGLVIAHVPGGRGRRARPVLIPGNRVEARFSLKPGWSIPLASLELICSRGPWLSEPLHAEAIAWVCALSAATLPERQPYPRLYSALGAVLEAICQAPSARGWLAGVLAYEMLLLRELGYGAALATRPQGALEQLLAAMDAIAPALDHYLLADRRGDVMAARQRLRERLKRMLP